MSKITYMTQAELAEELGVDRRQIHSWWVRRERNGFPEHDHEELRRGSTPSKVWKLADVRRWRQGYVPALGGRKPRSD